MPYQWLKMKGVPDDFESGGAHIAEFNGDILDYIANVKERRGTSTDKLTIDDADTKFIEYRFDCGATSGDNRGIYLRLYMTGAGGGGEALRAYTDVVGVAQGTCHGAHLSLGFGESTTGGSITGLGAAVRATLGLPNVAMGAGGTYCAIMCEIYSFGAASDPGAVTELSFFRVVNGGNSTGGEDVDDDAHLFSLQGFTIGTGNLVEAAVSEAEYAHNIRILVGTTEMYLMCASART